MASRSANTTGVIWVDRSSKAEDRCICGASPSRDNLQLRAVAPIARPGAVGLGNIQWLVTAAAIGPPYSASSAGR